MRIERPSREVTSEYSQETLREARASSSSVSPDFSVPAATIDQEAIPPQLNHTPHSSTAFSPDTIASDLLTADLASTRWLDLLAHDAAQADKTFSLAPTRCSSPVADRNVEQFPVQIAPPSSVSDPTIQSTAVAEARTIASVAPANEHHSWQLDHDIPLQAHEVHLFRAFVEHSASWLDLCDPQKHFSTHATRLAVSTSMSSRDVQCESTYP